MVALSDGPDLASREATVRTFIAAEYPRHYLGAVPILPSHEVTLTPDPFVRVCTAVLDAYLHPVMSRFLYRVEDELRKSGYARPLLVAQSNGGTSRVAKTTAIRTWGSGPAGGVAGAAALARHLGLEGVVAVDVGGTSSDVAVLRGAEWTYAVQPTIDGVPASLPVLELESIGIGGGSIASVASGELSVGPRSAGSHPGPAAFGLGGQDATVTDAACALGVFDPAHFLGGRKRLDGDAARRAIEEKIAAPLGVSLEEAARRMLALGGPGRRKEIARSISARGLSGAATWLFATGGAGGLLATAMAEEAGLAGAIAVPAELGVQRVRSLPARPAARLRSSRRWRRSREIAIGLSPSARWATCAARDRSGRRVATSRGRDGRCERQRRSGRPRECYGRPGPLAERLCAQPNKPRLFSLKAIAPGRRAAPSRREALANVSLTPRGPSRGGQSREARRYSIGSALVPAATIAGPAIVESRTPRCRYRRASTARVGTLGELASRG